MTEEEAQRLFTAEDAQRLYIEISAFAEKNTEPSNYLTLLRPELDGVELAPSNHNMLYQYWFIRVLSVTIPPDKKEETHHTHEYPSVMYVDRPSKKIKIDEVQENGEIKTFRFTPTGGFSFTSSESLLHCVTNLDTEKPYLAFRIEFQNSQFKTDPNLQQRTLAFFKSIKDSLDLLRRYLVNQNPLSQTEKPIFSYKSNPFFSSIVINTDLAPPNINSDLVYDKSS